MHMPATPPLREGNKHRPHESCCWDGRRPGVAESSNTSQATAPIRRPVRFPSVHSKLFPFTGDIGHYYYGPGHPMKPHRLKLAHHLLLSYNLYREMDVYRPHLATTSVSTPRTRRRGVRQLGGERELPSFPCPESRYLSGLQRPVPLTNVSSPSSRATESGTKGRKGRGEGSEEFSKDLDVYFLEEKDTGEQRGL